MSTFYAAFQQVADARMMVQELLQRSVRPDDISLVTKQVDPGANNAEMTETNGSVGDATNFVGRDDDPDHDEFSKEPRYTDVTSTHEAKWLAGISTTEKERDVDSVDQSDDSQAMAEDMIDPPNAISHSEHERDDIGLALRTGYPTNPPVIDNDFTEGDADDDQNLDTLETITVPGHGTVEGMGGLTTAALEYLRPDDNGDEASLRQYLTDKGVPEDACRSLLGSLQDGGAILEVGVTLGETDPLDLENIAGRYQAQFAEMYDAPRFHEAGGGMKEEDKGYLI